MVSADSYLGDTKQMKSSKNLVDDVNPFTNETNWITDDIPVTIFRFSIGSSGAVHYLSNNVEELTGYPKTDFIDQKLSWADIIFQDDNKYYGKVIQKAIKSKTSYQVEYRIKKADDSTVFIQEQAHLVSDDKGNITYIDGVFLDVTQQVKKYEEYQKVIINRTSKPLLVYFVDSSKKIKYINNYFVETCNVKNADDLIGLSPSDIIESSTLARSSKSSKSIAEEVLETGKGVYNIEGFIKFKGADKELFVMCSCVPIKNEAGVLTGSLMVLTDLTKIKEKGKEIQDLLNYTNICLKELLMSSIGL
jgi:methyl-accepting chemotaxis protein